MTGDDTRSRTSDDAEDDELPTGPPIFRDAVAALLSTRLRAEVRIETLRAPQRLAPYSYALGAEVIDANGDGVATGRLVLLHDPDGHEAWDGVLRLVAFASLDLDGADPADQAMGTDPMLPRVGWSWLTGALDERAAAYHAAGGTVTQTTSTRFGDIAGPSTTVAMEMRASWTAEDAELGAHLGGFADMLCAAAGLPPEGVTVLSRG